MTNTEIQRSSTWLSGIVIRNVYQDDLIALEWEGEFTHFRKLYAEAYRRAQRKLSVLWVADLEGTGIIGQVFIQLLCDRPELCNGIDRAYLYAFRVRDAYRSHGVGALLLNTVEEDLIRRGYRYLTLNVARDNFRAQEFYERHDFHKVAPEPGTWSYIDDQDRIQHVVEPAWRMEKRLL
jgi:ribosomal protein S18 acetylase RimI-like enzyme